MKKEIFQNSVRVSTDTNCWTYYYVSLIQNKPLFSKEVSGYTLILGEFVLYKNDYGSYQKGFTGERANVVSKTKSNLLHNISCLASTKYTDEDSVFNTLLLSCKNYVTGGNI